MNKENQSLKKIKWLLASVMIGSVIGGVIALLYAPKSGKRLRKDISRKTNELIEDGKKVTSDSWSAVKEKAESTFNNANNFISEGIEKITHNK